jgi:hypothetical protein
MHSLPPNEEVSRDFGTAEIGGQDVASELLKAGWAKMKETKREPTEEDSKKKELENEAKAAGKGLWNPHGPKVLSFPVSIRLTLDVEIPGPHHSPHNANRFSGVYFRMEG